MATAMAMISERLSVVCDSSASVFCLGCPSVDVVVAGGDDNLPSLLVSAVRLGDISAPRVADGLAWSAPSFAVDDAVTVDLMEAGMLGVVVVPAPDCLVGWGVVTVAAAAAADDRDVYIPFSINMRIIPIRTRSAPTLRIRLYRPVIARALGDAELIPAAEPDQGIRDVGDVLIYEFRDAAVAGRDCQATTVRTPCQNLYSPNRQFGYPNQIHSRATISKERIEQSPAHTNQAS